MELHGVAVCPIAIATVIPILRIFNIQTSEHVLKGCHICTVCEFFIEFPDKWNVMETYFPFCPLINAERTEINIIL